MISVPGWGGSLARGCKPIYPVLPRPFDNHKNCVQAHKLPAAVVLLPIAATTLFTADGLSCANEGAVYARHMPGADQERSNSA